MAQRSLHSRARALATADRYQVVVHVDAQTLRDRSPGRRAIRARDAGCRFPGCTRQRHLDAHHIQHWADGGPTQLKNLVALCRQHHRLVHEGGIMVRMSPEGIPHFLRPDGAAFDGIIWRGERMDYDLGVHVLLQHAARSQDVSAETSEQIF
jgi:hypothetical protein